jgi:1,2-diacylglycerol 3-alpha-glucosyltransferase
MTSGIPYMRLCFVSSHFPQPCGIASYTHYLGEALCLLDPSFQGTIIAEEPAQPSQNGPLCLTGTFQYDDNYPEHVFEQIKAATPDIVHFQHEYGLFGYDRRFLNLLSRLHDEGIPTIVTLHTVHTKLSFNVGCMRPYLRHLLKDVDIEAHQREIGELANLVIVHQENSMRQVLLRQGISPEKVVVIPHGTLILDSADTRAAKRTLSFEAEEPLVLAFGYLERSKNLLLLIEAFRRLKTKVPRAKLWLGGYVRYDSIESLQYRDRCQNLIEESGFEDDIVFARTMIPEAQMPTVLAAADVASFVYNEDTHCSSGAVHLAMGLGKPIVASRIPKFGELSEVSDEILVNPNSVRELHRLLRRILVDESFKQYIQQRVRLYAQRTSWSYVAERHKKVYDGLVAPLGLPLNN